MEHKIYKNDIHQMVNDILTLIENNYCILNDDEYNSVADSLEEVLLKHFNFPDYKYDE